MPSRRGRRVSTATDLADYLVARGVRFAMPTRPWQVPFAMPLPPESISPISMVRDSRRSTRSSVTTLRAVLTVDGSVAARRHVGGTAPEQVASQVRRHRDRLATD